MRAARLLVPLLASGLTLVGGCGYQEMTGRPAFADQSLQSLCDYGRPVLLRNRGTFESRNSMGELLLVAQVANQPLETFLNYELVRLDYQPVTGLTVTLTDFQGRELTELIPPKWISCGEDAMELKLPSDAFYIWAAVGVKTRHLYLQVARDGGLVMRHVWEEKGMAMMVFPLKFTGDGWASFAPDHSGEHPPVQPALALASLGDCQDLSGTYEPVATSVRLDGSIDEWSARAQFFRPEIVGEQAMADDAPDPQALRLVHMADGSIQLALVLPDGQQQERFLDAATVSCESGQWLAKGKKDLMPAWMLLTGSAGGNWEDLKLSRDRDGALLVHGTRRTRGTLFLIPHGETATLFMRFALLAND